MKQELRDSNGRPIGSITITSSGKHEGRDANGRMKGSYDPKTNQTRDSSGRLVGKGNVLAAVVTSSLFV
jgi:hypothetical protein